MTKHVWIVCARFGQLFKPYLPRQIRAFSRFRTTVVTWRFENPSRFDDIRVEALDRTPEPYVRRLGNLVWRLRHLAQENKLAATSEERAWLHGLAARDRPDAILAHCGHFGLRVLPVAEALGVPLVTHFHGVDVFPMQGDPKYRASIPLGLRRFARVVVVAECQKRWVLERGVPEDRVSLIPCGAPIATDSELPPEKAEGEPVVFLTVSTLIPIKGHEVTLKAFKHALDKGMNGVLRIVGDGPLREQLRRLTSSLDLAERVTFLGELPSEGALAEMNACDVFLQHSLDTPWGPNEGASVSVTEAAGRKRPLIVSDCGGHGDLVEDGVSGFLVPQKDVAVMGDRMCELAADHALRVRFAEVAYQLVSDDYDSAKQALRLESVVLDALENG